MKTARKANAEAAKNGGKDAQEGPPAVSPFRPCLTNPFYGGQKRCSFGLQDNDGDSDEHFEHEGEDNGGDQEKSAAAAADTTVAEKSAAAAADITMVDNTGGNPKEKKEDEVMLL